MKAFHRNETIKIRERCCCWRRQVLTTAGLKTNRRMAPQGHWRLQPQVRRTIEVGFLLHLDRCGPRRAQHCGKKEKEERRV